MQQEKEGTGWIGGEKHEKGKPNNPDPEARATPMCSRFLNFLGLKTPSI
jgi:hypothetical protein